MNSVTCQARGERHRSRTTGEFRADGSAGRSLRPSWGSQATLARMAGRAHTTRAPRQPTPANCDRGTLTPAASAALIFFFNDTATTEISTLSLHDALPI